MKKFFLYCLTTLLLLHIYYGEGYCHIVKLRTEIHWISNEQLYTRANNFTTFFTPVGSPLFRNSYEQLNRDAVKEWEKSIPDTSGVDVVHVLRIFYGLDKTNPDYKIKLIYLPDNAIYSSGDTFTFQQPADPGDDVDVYTSDNLAAPVKYGTVRHYVDAYRAANAILVNRLGCPGAALLPIDFATPNNDAKGITLPFQEIRNFFGFSGINDIYFINVAERDEIHNNNYLKHAIAVSSKPPAPDMSGAVSADLGALCPPRCNDISIIAFQHLPFYRFLPRLIFKPGMHKDDWDIQDWIFIGEGVILGALIRWFSRRLRRKNKKTEKPAS